MRLRQSIGRLAKFSARQVEEAVDDLVSVVNALPAGSACNSLKNTTRVILMVTIPSLFSTHPARGQDKMDAGLDNGNGSLLTGSLGLTDEELDASLASDGMVGCPPDEPTPDGRKLVQGSCVFTMPGADGTRFKMELQNAIALLDADMNVELKVGGIRGIEGVESPPRIRVCGSKHCMNADIDQVGWVLRTGDNEVQVKSELGEVLVTTTYDVAETVNEGEWVNISLDSPDDSNMPANCAIRWTKGSKEGDDYTLAAMASLLYLEMLRRRRKKKK